MMLFLWFMTWQVQAQTQPSAQSIQMAPGQSIGRYLDANPQIQKTWITSEDRKRAALAKYSETCRVGKKNCNRLKSFDRITQSGNNRIARNFVKQPPVK